MHRFVLYESIGGAIHPCTWCGKAVTWMARIGKTGVRANDLVVDHLDHNTRNNSLSNLVPACTRCNVLRGMMKAWQSETGKTVSDLRL